MAKKSKFVKRLIWESKRCYYCGVSICSDSATVDHVVAKSLGGGNEPENLVACCKSCNSAKGDKTLDDFRILLALNSSEWKGVFSVKQVKMLMLRGHDIGVKPDLVKFYGES